jgi:hypothetical protein
MHIVNREPIPVTKPFLSHLTQKERETDREGCLHTHTHTSYAQLNEGMLTGFVVSSIAAAFETHLLKKR